MPPVEVINEKGATRRLKFLRNTSYNGKDYGPDYESDEADVDPRWTANFLANGRAVEVEAAKSKAAPGGPAPGEVQVRDPDPEHRDPQLPSQGAKKN